MNDIDENGSRLGKAGDRPSWIRNGSVFIRAAHLLAASAIAGAYLGNVEVTVAHVWWLVAGVSGMLLLATEFLWHRDLLREPAGWATIIKLLLVGGIPAVPCAAGWLISGAIVVAALGAHAPRRWRHRRLF
jgi:hypothetical protein